MGGKGSDSETVTNRVDIPGFLRPLAGSQSSIAQRALTDLSGAPTPLGKAGLVPGQGPGATDDGLLFGDTLAGFAPQQEQALELMEQRAMGAGGFLPTFQDQLLSTAQGQNFIGGTGVEQLQSTASGQAIDAPGFQSAFETALRRAQPQIQGAFTLAGRSGAGLESVAQSQAAADAFAGLFGQERNRQVGAAGTLADLRDAERRRQAQATAQLPGAALFDVGLLQDVGQQIQQQRQAEIDAPIEARERLLALAGGPLSLNALLGQSQTSPLHSSPTSGALGGGLSGAAVGAQIGGPWGALIGGGAGALLGSGALD